MISSLTGTLQAAGAGWVHLVVSGVGFRVEVPSGTSVGHVGSEMTLHTNLIVREDALTLFGFSDSSDRDGFEILMTVSGIGPRLALAAIDTLGMDSLRGAVASQDLKTLQLIPGVGKKTAQRMVLEIGDKLGPAPVAGATASPATPTTSAGETVRSALEQLGWSRAVAEQTVAELEALHPTTESLLRAALAALGGSHG